MSDGMTTEQAANALVEFLSMSPCERAAMSALCEAMNAMREDRVMVAALSLLLQAQGDPRALDMAWNLVGEDHVVGLMLVLSLANTLGVVRERDEAKQEVEKLREELLKLRMQYEPIDIASMLRGDS